MNKVNRRSWYSPSDQRMIDALEHAPVRLIRKQSIGDIAESNPPLIFPLVSQFSCVPI